MAFAKTLSLLLLTGSLLGAQSLLDDPVMKARAQRAQAQGINEADLPPMPRSVTEPPPLPPPEIHLKDTRGGRAAKSQRKAKTAALKGKGAAKGHKASVKSRKQGPVSAGPAAPKRASGKNLGKPTPKHSPKAAKKKGKR